MSAPTLAPKQYRPEIQGLRAIASLLVAAYHVWLGRVSGGVDVFFVVSAFLVTTSLLNQVEARGQVQFARFWSGLVKRLVPAAVFVLLVTVVAAILWLPRGRWADMIVETVTSAMYLENWYLAFKSIDYLAQTGPSPVRHFWALSTQGQFYLLWPLFVAALAFVASRLDKRFRTVAFTGFGTVFIVSLAYSVVATRANQQFTYFNTVARLWEFAIGAMLALSISSIRLSLPWRLTAGWVGLIAILSCGFILQVSRVFPGYAALWPTVSAALIIVAGSTGHKFGADRLLSSSVLTKLGDASYSLYLWHWPVNVFFRVLTGRDHPGLAAGLFIIGLALVLALMTTRWLENPVRESRLGAEQAGRTLAFGAVCLALLLSVVGGWRVHAARAEKFDGRPIAASDPNYPGALAMESGFRYTGQSTVPVYPGPLAVEEDRPAVYHDNCFQNLHDSEPIRCAYGDLNGSQTVALVGGSHAAHWLPALRAIAGGRGWKIIVYTKNRCLFTAEMTEVFGKDYVSCKEWNDSVMAELLRDPPQMVFTTATHGSGASERTAAGRIDRWRTLNAAGIKVIAIRDTPRMGMNVPECVELNAPAYEKCARPRAALLAPVPPYRHLEGTLEGVAFIDPNDYLCTEQLCLSVIGNVLVYRDDAHLTTAFVRTFAPVLNRELSKKLAELETDRHAPAR